MKLIYFNIHGRGQPIRLIFSLAGVDYEKEYINLGFGQNLLTDWKPRQPEFPLEQLPVLETDDGEIFPQTIAISNYLALKFDLKGNTERDRLVSTSLAVSANDLLEKCGRTLHVFLVYKYFPLPDNEVLEKSKQGVISYWQRLCSLAEKYQRVKHAGKPFINGEKITEADIMLWSAADYVRQALPDLECSEWYKGLEKNFLADEGVKNYLENRFQAAY